jgi:hypothetical protein
MAPFTPVWEDRGFRSWLASRYSSGAALVTILAVISLREVFPLSRLFPAAGARGAVERVLAFLLLFALVYVFVGFVWYHVMRQRSAPASGRFRIDR